MSNNQSDAIKTIIELRESLKLIRQQPRMSPEFQTWKAKVDNFLCTTFGEHSKEHSQLLNIIFEPSNTNSVAEYERVYWKGITDIDNFLLNLTSRLSLPLKSAEQSVPALDLIYGKRKHLFIPRRRGA